ncbi:MAG: LamG-like jellyroll fold domain-containing protein [Hyphomicrobiaceae bacterium]
MSLLLTRSGIAGLGISQPGTPPTPPTHYHTIVEGIADLLAHWPGLVDTGEWVETQDDRHATLTGTPSVSPGLAEDSDNASHFAGDAGAVVPHDSGLLLAALTLSWFSELRAVPEGSWYFIGKDGSGVFDGDWGVRYTPQLTLNSRQQTVAGGSLAGVSVPVEVGVKDHWAVALSGAGLELWRNGRFVGVDATYGGAWSVNTGALHFASTAFNTLLANVVLDEVALYSRVLTDAQIITLSQNTALPVAVAVAGVVVTEAQAVQVDVIDQCTWVGRKSNLTVEFVQGARGTATVDSNKVITYAADADEGGETDTVQYRIVDENGTGAYASIEIAINAAAGPGAGDLDDDYGVAAEAVGNILAAWRFGDGSGATVADDSGNGWAGSYVGTPLYGQTGLAFSSDKTAIRTNGAGYPTVPHNSAISPAAGAFGVWFQLPSLATQATIVHKGANYQVVVLTNGTLRFIWRGQQVDTWDGYVVAGVRCHAMAAFDGTDVRFYADGFLAGGLKETSGLAGITDAWVFGRSTGGVTGDVILHEAFLFGSAKKTFAHAVALAEGQRGLAYHASRILRTVPVSSAAQLTSALAAAIPGDAIVCANGNYAGPFTLSANGTNKNPIIVKAANLLGAKFTGAGDFTISGNWCVLDGFDTDPGASIIINGGTRSRVTRCRRTLFTQHGVAVSNATHTRADHCTLTEPRTSAVAAPYNIHGSSAPHALTDHCFSQWNGPNTGNGHDTIITGTGNANSSLRTRLTIYKWLIDDYNYDENMSLKSSDIRFWYGTVRNGNVYASIGRHGRRQEARSCYFRKTVRSQGEGHRFIGSTFNGVPLNLGSGDFSQTEFETDNDLKGHSACENAFLAGNTFVGSGRVIYGFEANGTAELASGAVAEGNINFAVTHLSAADTLTNAGSTTQWFETAVELFSGDVGHAAADPLVPTGYM